MGDYDEMIPHPEWSKNPDWIPDRMGADRERIETAMALIRVIDRKLDDVLEELRRINRRISDLGV